MAKKFHLPELNWFEFEVLSQLISSKKFGNELLVELNKKFGEGTISSGKLYPVLQKMEKRKFIKRLKEKSKEKIDGSRGMERVYYSLTPEGQVELENSTYHYTYSFVTGLLERLQLEVIKKCFQILKKEIGTSSKVGIAKLCINVGLEEMLSRFEEAKGFNYYILDIPYKDIICNVPSPESLPFELTYIPSKIDDIPLKDNYLEAVAVVTLISDIDDYEILINEISRIIKPGGLILIIDFAKFDSYILEALMKRIHQIESGDEDFLGIDVDDVIKILKTNFKDIKVEKMKEIVLICGKKI
jgi:DNA-binding PadR family transcriptional regulator